MSKKKFSLGAIIQKINEENSPPDSIIQNRPADTKDSNSEIYHQRKSPFFPTDKSIDTEPLSDKVNSPSKLPDQPVISKVKHHHNNNVSSTPSTEKVSQVPQSSPAPIHNYTANTIRTDEDEEEEFDPLKYISVIIRRRNIVLAAMLIMALLSVYKFLSGDKYYIANARLLFRPGDQEMIGDANMYRYYIDRDKIFSTHLELLKSHTVLSIVSQNLDNRISENAISPRLTIRPGETDGNKNDIIELSFKYPNPDTARDVLNELCRTYIDYRREVNTQELTRFIFKFETQINKLQAELDSKENALRSFKEENQMVQLSSETNLIVSKLSEMELALQKTQLSLLESKERLSALNSQINLQDHDIVQSITYQDPLQTKIADLELELNTSTAEYSAEHYKVKMLKQQIEKLKTAAIDSISKDAASKTLVKNPIRQALLQDLINLTIEKAALEAKRIAQEQIIDKLNRDLLQQPSLEQKYANLQRETESVVQTLRLLKTKYEEAKIKRDSQESDLKLLELAQTPTTALSNVKFTNIIVGILIGLILGIALVFLIEYLDQSLKDPTDIEKQLELPLLGIVPQIEAEQALIEQTTDLTKTILEPFRALRANLKHIAAAHELKTFMVCSAVKGEGKTTLAANLAITFALDGKNVILIDADLRRSQMHSLFSIPKQTGVADYLMGTATVDQIIKSTRYPNLFIVTSGERPHNPAELLGTIRFDLLIEDLKTKAEIVIFDSPALLPVSDTITMAPKMDCCVVVARALWTPLKAAKQAKNQLKRIGCKLYGGILNGVSHAKNYYPYYYGYYGYYSYKYTYEEDISESRFSIRKLGLQIENKLKNKISCAVFAFPKYIAALSQLIRLITMRKRFWVLLFALLLITGLRIWFEATHQEPIDSIKYIGIGDSKNSTKDTVTNSFSDMAIPQNKLSDKTESWTLPPDKSPKTVNLDDSIKMWLKAKSDKDIDRFLNFYNDSLFTFPAGRFDQWRQKTIKQFSEQKKGTVFNLVNAFYNRNDSTYQEISLDLIEVSDGDSITSSVTTIWHSGNRGWKIIREKSISRKK
ncbi:MAG TPA: polysaccharide biosynthesis tyrosine autokinase [Chitinispirillaceae bacterium]|nr:polysaccharide biosynthesis tyrosine autokinase [Chitinispirillaceae bacterium]